MTSSNLAQGTEEIKSLSISQKTSVMANWSEIPGSVLIQIVSFLPLRDKINTSFICGNWFQELEHCYDTIYIDPSTPFGDSWVEFNRYQIGLTSGDKSTLLNEMTKMIDDLSRCTRKIKHINMDCTILREHDLTRLFATQENIVTLRLRNDSETGVVFSPAMFKELVLGMLKQRNYLSVVDVSLHATPESLPLLDEVYKCKENNITFPRLTSLKFKPVSSLGNNFSLLFESCFLKNKMMEIGQETEWLTVSLSYLLERGNLCEVTGLDRKISEEESKSIMQKCLKVKHIGENFQIVDDDGSNSQLCKMIEKYGAQLISIKCNISKECCKTIKSFCENLKAIKLKCLCHLDLISNLKHIKRLYCSSASLSQCGILAKFECLPKLEALSMELKEETDANHLAEIKFNCNQLKELNLNIGGKNVLRVSTTKPMFEYLDDFILSYVTQLPLAYNMDTERLFDMFQRCGSILKEYRMLCSPPVKHLIVSDIPKTKLVFKDFV